MKRIQIEFQDENRAQLFEDELRNKFNIPKSKYEITHGTDENGNFVFISNKKQSKTKSKHLFSSVLIKSGYFSYCVDDFNGYCQEFETLAEAKRFAKQHSKEHSDQEFTIYGMSSFHYINGKEV